MNAEMTENCTICVTAQTKLVQIQNIHHFCTKNNPNFILCSDYGLTKAIEYLKQAKQLYLTNAHFQRLTAEQNRRCS